MFNQFSGNRFVPRLAIAALIILLLSPLGRALAVEIPDFTPNVVDPAGVLDDADRQKINAELQKIREAQHIWGAVYIVPSLEDDSIENLAVTAFQKWQLGQKGVDNGLLLVLAMQEHRSRFEVGYGLEGVITDVAARHALDDYLAPKMRDGDIAGASIDAFDFLARVAASDPATIDELARQTAQETGHDDDSAFSHRGMIAWCGLFVLIWIMPTLRRIWMQRTRARLLCQHPELAGMSEAVAESRGRSWTGGLFLRIFLTINPGVFVVILPSVFPPLFYILLGVEILILVLVLRFSARRYQSPEAYRRFLQKQAQERSTLMRKGHVVETAPGVFAYTAAYYASQRSRSSSSSSSGSSSSSSSGGGSSGGGGASSGW